jgi:hypothetical protein
VPNWPPRELARLGLCAGQIEHDHAIGLQAVVAQDVTHRVAQLGPRMLGVRLARIENQHDQRHVRVAELETAALPVVPERPVQTLVQGPTPLGVGGGRIVSEQIIGRVMQPESGQLLRQPSRQLGARHRLERLVILAAPLDLLGRNRPKHPLAVLQQHAAVQVFGDDLTRQVQWTPVPLGGYVVQPRGSTADQPATQTHHVPRFQYASHASIVEHLDGSCYGILLGSTAKNV